MFARRHIRSLQSAFFRVLIWKGEEGGGRVVSYRWICQKEFAHALIRGSLTPALQRGFRSSIILHDKTFIRKWKMLFEDWWLPSLDEQESHDYCHCFIRATFQDVHLTRKHRPGTMVVPCVRHGILTHFLCQIMEWNFAARLYHRRIGNILILVFCMQIVGFRIGIDTWEIVQSSFRPGDDGHGINKRRCRHQDKSAVRLCVWFIVTRTSVTGWRGGGYGGHCPRTGRGLCESRKSSAKFGSKNGPRSMILSLGERNSPSQSETGSGLKIIYGSN